MRPHELQPVRLSCPWDFPGKTTAVGCHFPSPEGLPGPGIEPMSPALQANSLPPSHRGSLLAATCGIQFPDQGLNLGPLHSEHRVLAAGPPEKSIGSWLLIPSSSLCEGPQSFMTFQKENLNSCSHEIDISEKYTERLILWLLTTQIKHPTAQHLLC